MVKTYAKNFQDVCKYIIHNNATALLFLPVPARPVGGGKQVCWGWYI